MYPATVVDRSPRRRGTAFAGSAWQTPDGARSHALVAVDLDAPDRAPASLPLTFLAHGVVPDPACPHRAAVFEKHGPGAAIVDLATMTVSRVLPPVAGRQFYGHGAFSRDGTRLYCTETDVDDRRRGWLGVFDGADFARLGELPTGGRAPHDCWLLDERTLVVGNGGGAIGEPDPPCVVWIDRESGACLERRDQPDPRHDVGHLALAAGGEVVVASAPRFGTDDPAHAPGGLVITRRGAPALAIDGPDEIVAAMIGETLSVALHAQSGTVAATSPEGNQLAFWSLVDGRSRGRLRIPNPRGVALTLGADEFVVSFGAHGKLVRIDAATLAPIDAPGNRQGIAVGATGSHLLVHDLGA